MPERANLIADLGGEAQYGVLLVAQLGGAPNELQLIIETAEYDPAAQGLRPKHNYIVRALGVREHRVHLGVFARLTFVTEHPLLYHHNTPRVAVQFEGRAADVHELVLDVYQAYVSTFGPWRNLAEIGGDLNPTLPLVALLRAEHGLLGTMPKPLAERMARVLAHHGLLAMLSEQADFEIEDEHGRSRLAQVLVLDDSAIVALDFSVERIGKR